MTGQYFLASVVPKDMAAATCWIIGFHKLHIKNHMQAQHLLPVALPANIEALARIADAVAEHNRAWPECQGTARRSSSEAGNTNAETVSLASSCQVPLTPWLAASLAPIGAAVTIQAHWRGRAERQRQGPLGAQLLHRRAAVCIQRAWRMCTH